MKKIGLLGGTFNPIHNGHLVLAKRAYEQCHLDEVWFIPSGISYMKKDQKIPAGDIRLKMVDLAIQDIEYYKSSRVEIDRQGNTYTVDTLRELRSLYPDSEFYFIIGDDTLFTMETWYKIDQIFALCNVIVSIRNYNKEEIIKQIAYLEATYHAHIFSVEAPALEISSTTIRELALNQKDFGALVPESVKKYIIENKIYEL